MNNNLGRQFRVLDFQTAKLTKQVRGKALRVEADSPAMIKHEDKAMELGNPAPKKKSMMDKMTAPISRFLGFEE